MHHSYSFAPTVTIKSTICKEPKAGRIDGSAVERQPDAKQSTVTSSGIDRRRSEQRAATGGTTTGFFERSYESAAGTRHYKLYVPASAARSVDATRPLLVMLHGCTQSPDDFAAGTRMNQLADLHDFLVAYPAQATSANGMKCWNWFREADQSRDAGEPALLAGITRQIMAEFAVNPRRIVVAGMSAGAAMAVILGATYPELYAAVGAHSGLPYRAARTAAEAMAAMRGARTVPDRRALVKRARSLPPYVGRFVPTIAFHGDADSTVDASNGAALVAQAVAQAEAAGRSLQKLVQERRDAGGREVTVTTYRDSTRTTVVEYWLVHGGGHAWSGGSPDGSYTDAAGPDASAHMVRFLLSRTSED